jgi:hypothetical protein
LLACPFGDIFVPSKISFHYHVPSTWFAPRLSFGDLFVLPKLAFPTTFLLPNLHFACPSRRSFCLLPKSAVPTYFGLCLPFCLLPQLAFPSTFLWPNFLSEIFLSPSKNQAFPSAARFANSDSFFSDSPP